MQAVREQRHGTERDTRYDLDEHHDRGDADDDERLAFAGPPSILAEGVVVSQIQIAHWLPSGVDRRRVN